MCVCKMKIGAERLCVRTRACVWLVFHQQLFSSLTLLCARGLSCADGWLAGYFGECVSE